MPNGFEQKVDIEKKFQKVFKEITFLQYKIDQKQGFIIFKSHVYSQESLLKTEHYSKINSITKKIGDDIINWNKYGQLSAEGKECYEKGKKLVRDELEKLHKVIAHREPTWWEQVEVFFKHYLVLIQENMPDVPFSVIGAIIQFFSLPPLPGFIKNILALPPSNSEN
jgi:phage anti-repressor protein